MKDVFVKSNNEKSVLVISFIISVLSAYSALRGFLDENLYGEIISTGVFKMSYMSGTISQDIITIVSAAIMLTLIVLYTMRKDIRVFISIIGLLSFYFYAYGTYVISGLYTSIYLVYMVIFMLSIFGIIIGVSCFEREYVKGLSLPKWVRILSAAFLSLIASLFVPMWIARMIPHIQSHTLPDFYAIFILDLCIVMPFFIYLVYMLFRNHKLSYVLLGLALVKTITLILSVAIGEMFVPANGGEADVAMVVVYSIITIISALLFVFYCRKLMYCLTDI